MEVNIDGMSREAMAKLIRKYPSAYVIGKDESLSTWAEVVRELGGEVRPRASGAQANSAVDAIRQLAERRLERYYSSQLVPEADESASYAPIGVALRPVGENVIHDDIANLMKRREPMNGSTRYTFSFWMTPSGAFCGGDTDGAPMVTHSRQRAGWTPPASSDPQVWVDDPSGDDL